MAEVPLVHPTSLFGVQGGHSSHMRHYEKLLIRQRVLVGPSRLSTSSPGPRITLDDVTTLAPLENGMADMVQSPSPDTPMTMSPESVEARVTEPDSVIQDAQRSLPCRNLTRAARYTATTRYYGDNTKWIHPQTNLDRFPFVCTETLTEADLGGPVPRVKRHQLITDIKSRIIYWTLRYPHRFLVNGD
ncbi:Hypothetical protein D9617_6g092820 [Elsinoe fawcettii]|nr:Hypothetical protein D9617_6g092820 [Elsinoe fawcettii]